MIRIIVAEDIQAEPVVEPAVSTPVQEVQPEPEIPAAQTPLNRQRPAPKQTDKTKINQHYKNIDALHAAFKEELKNCPVQPGGTEKVLNEKANDIFDQVTNAIAPNGETFLDWAAKVYYSSKKKFEPNLSTYDARNFARELILYGLIQYRPGTLIAGIQKDSLHKELSNEVGVSKKTEARYNTLKDYLLWLAHPENQDPNGKGKVDEDLINKIGTVDENGQKFTPAHAAEEMRKRVQYLDVPVAGDEQGRNRIQYAKDAFADYFSTKFAGEKQQYEANLNAMPPNQRINFAKKDFHFADRWELVSVDPVSIQPKMSSQPTFNQRYNELKHSGADMSYFEKVKPDGTPNEFWINPEMLYEISPEVLNDLWSRATHLAKPTTEAIEVPLGTYEDTQNRTHPLRKSEDDNPNDVLENIFNSILDNPEGKIQDDGTIKSRLGLIMPYKPAPNGIVQKNPAFKKSLDYVIDQLYGPNSKPLFRDRAMDDRTKHVLSLIGKDFAEKFNKSDVMSEQRFRNTNLEDAIQQYLPDIGLRYIDQDVLDDIDVDNIEQMKSIATGEIMTDILNFLRNDNNYAELQRMSGGNKAMAELKNIIRVAAFLAKSKIILRG